MKPTNATLKAWHRGVVSLQTWERGTKFASNRLPIAPVLVGDIKISQTWYMKHDSFLKMLDKGLETKENPFAL